MREWFTAQELAGLPELPTTDRRVRALAKRESWVSRQRSGRGGGLEYHLQSLPQRAQAALILRAHRAGARQSPADSSPAGGPGSPDQADGRASLTAQNSPPHNQGGAAGSFEYDPESLTARFERQPAEKRAEAERISVAIDRALVMIEQKVPARDAWATAARSIGMGRATLQRWHARVRKYQRPHWPAAALKNYQGREPFAKFTPAAWQFLLTDYLRLERPSLAACYQRLLRAAGEKGWDVPPERTVYHHIERLRREQPTRVVLRRDGEAALMRMYPALDRSVAELHALEWINGDGYQHNVFVRWPDDTIARPKTWFWQDVYSRKIIGFRTDETEHSDVIRLALGDVIEHWGIPRHATIDNTRAAANKWLTGGVPNRYRFTVREDDPLGLLPSLGVQVHWTSVNNGRGHGQAKPVERAFQSIGGLGDYVDRHLAFEGAYCGENPMAKPENYGTKAIPLDDFLAVLAQEIRAWNARPGRRTEMAGGKLSYDQVFEDSYQRSTITRATSAQRRLWLMKAEKVRVAQDGCVTLQAGGVVGVGKNRYSGGDALYPYAGELVAVRFDPQRLHGTVHAYTVRDEYIGPCECILAAGYGDTSLGRQHTRARKTWMKAEKAAADALQTMSATEAARLLPEIEPDDALEPGVIEGRFRQQKQVVGSDVVPEDARADEQQKQEQKQRRRESMRAATALLQKQRWEAD